MFSNTIKIYPELIVKILYMIYAIFIVRTYIVSILIRFVVSNNEFSCFCVDGKSIIIYIFIT